MSVYAAAGETVYVRCPDCRASTWIQPEGLGSVRSVVCASCRRRHELQQVEGLADDHYQKALKLSESEGLDLPSAYSVLLGIMSPSQAAAARPPTRRAPRVPTPARPAVANRLGASQPPRRAARGVTAGRRNGHDKATRPAPARRGLPLEPPPASRPGVSPAGAWLAGVLALVAAGAIGARGFSQWRGFVESARQVELAAPAPPPTVEPPPKPAPSILQLALAATRVETDRQGRITAVRGPNPAAVLVAYCDAPSQPVPCEPVELATTHNEQTGVSIGIFRDFANLSRSHMFRIRRDRRSGEWVAGNGSAPITTYGVGDLPLGRTRVPVSRPRSPSLASLEDEP